MNDAFLQNPEFKTFLDGLSLATDLYEDYLLQEIMSFQDAVHIMRTGDEPDDVGWTRKRAEIFLRLGFDEAADVFQDFIDLVTHVAENTATYPDVSIKALEALEPFQPELDALHDRMAAQAKIIPREALVRAVTASEQIELLPHKEAINSWVSLASQSKIYQETRAAAAADKTFDGNFSLEQKEALETKGVDWCFFLFEFQSDAAPRATRQLWQTNMGVLVTPFSPRTHSLLEVETWPSGQKFASIAHSAPKEGSHPDPSGTAYQHIDAFIQASKELTDIDTTGPLAALEKLPIGNAAKRGLLATFKPRSNFRFFRGMAQQGVKSSFILRQLGRSIFWSGVIFVLIAFGILQVALETVLSGAGSFGDIAFLLGLLIGMGILFRSVVTTAGLIIGSLDRRSDRLRWSSPLPQTGHENFITRFSKRS